MLRTFSVMPLVGDHFEERCADIIRQAQQNIAQTPLFMFTLLPEGKPLFDKAEGYRALFCRYRDRLASAGIVPAVLVQSSLGHGYPVDERTDLQYIINATYGNEENVMCPLDPGFHDYLYGAMAKVASFKPSYIMMDDDFRLYGRYGRGCACPRHMARFNKAAGTDFTREEWMAYSAGHGEEDPLVKVFKQTQLDTLKELAVTVRAGIDSVDPTIPGVTCNAGAYLDSHIMAPILAGNGNPVIVRSANGCYAPESTLFFSTLLHRSAVSANLYKGIADEVITEADTIPYSRYGKSAAFLHAHYLGTLLEGMQGAKHWITRLNEYAPEAGEAYRAILAEHAGLYVKIAAMAKDIRRVGCRVPTLAAKPEFCWDDNAFSECFLERIGVPFYTAEAAGGAVCMSGPIGQWYTKEELAFLTDEHLILASDAAADLAAMGYDSLLGVEVRPWQGPNISGERLTDCDTANGQVGARELIPDKAETETLSVNYHCVGHKEEPLSPGVTLYRRPNGKYTAVFCGTPKARHNYTEAFSFLCAARKHQFTDLLNRMGQLPVYCPSDAPVLLEAGWLPDGRMLIYFLNTGDDVLPNIPLIFDRPVTAAVRLDGNGAEQPLELTAAGETVTLNLPARHLMPEVLLISF